jgi:hypothetical protein
MLPFRSTFAELFSSDKSVWLKMLGGAVVTAMFAGFQILKFGREHGDEITKRPGMIALILAISALVGALLGGFLSLKDVVQMRMAEGRPVTLPLKLMFGYGVWSVLFIWSPTIIVGAFLIVMLTLS